MAYTLEQYETLQAAVASGSNTVKYSDKQVTYNSVDQMLRILAIMKAELYPDERPARRKLAEHHKGIFPTCTD